MYAELIPGSFFFLLMALGVAGEQAIRARIVDWALCTRLYPVDISSDWRTKMPGIKFGHIWGKESRELARLREGKRFVLMARVFSSCTIVGMVGEVVSLGYLLT